MALFDTFHKKKMTRFLEILILFVGSSLENQFEGLGKSIYLEVTKSLLYS